MLTKDDLKQIGDVVEEKLEQKLEQKLEPIRNDLSVVKKDMRSAKSDITKIRSDIDIIIDSFDRDYLDLRGRVERIEEKLGINY